jgi:hypothetical protein
MFDGVVVGAINAIVEIQATNCCASEGLGYLIAKPLRERLNGLPPFY